MFYNWFEGSFLFSYKEKISSKIFHNYLHQDLSYFYKRNSSEFIRNITIEAEQFNIYLSHILKLLLEIIVLLGMFIVLSSISFYFTTSVLIVFILRATK